MQRFRTLLIVLSVCLALGLGARYFGIWMGEGKWTEARGERLPELPMRNDGRMCCAFGTDLRAGFFGIALPFVAVGRIAEVDDMGPHRYDASWGALDDERGIAFPFGERNGLMYTCRGGFVDSSHLREAMDWTALFLSRLDGMLESGGVIDLPEEGASRRIVYQPIPRELIKAEGRDAVLMAVAQWSAWQVLMWHEIAQWYGISILRAFPETASGFSFEDSYSNAVGLHLLDDADIREILLSEKIYNRAGDEIVPAGLKALGPVPRELGSRATEAIEGTWWNRDVLLPARGTVIQRDLRVENTITPWMVPDELASPELRSDMKQFCGEDAQPKPFDIPDRIGGLPITDFARYEITLDGRLADEPALAKLGRHFDQRAFPQITEDVRAQGLELFGPGFDQIP
ncbi:DUF4056 domain-containing protein [Myxococcota bacterium]|nr:DUF4056 domain-containing protein [Myxococcota bacterium]